MQLSKQNTKTISNPQNFYSTAIREGTESNDLYSNIQVIDLISNETDKNLRMKKKSRKCVGEEVVAGLFFCFVVVFIFGLEKKQPAKQHAIHSAVYRIGSNGT